MDKQIWGLMVPADDIAPLVQGHLQARVTFCLSGRFCCVVEMEFQDILVTECQEMIYSMNTYILTFQSNSVSKRLLTTMQGLHICTPYNHRTKQDQYYNQI